MKRRDFLALSGAAAVFPPVAFAQPTAKVPHIVLFVAATVLPEFVETYKRQLAGHGYIDGKNITLEVVVYPGTADRALFAARVVASRPDLIVTHGDTTVVELQSITKAIPIVFGAAIDPIGLGVTESLARPTGNATGTSLLAPDLTGKQIAIVKEIIPPIKRLAILNQPLVPSIAGLAAQAQLAAKWDPLESTCRHASLSIL